MVRRKHVHHKKYKNFKKHFKALAAITPSMYRSSNGGIHSLAFDTPPPTLMTAPSVPSQRNLVPSNEPPTPSSVVPVEAVARRILPLRRGPQLPSPIATA